MELGKVMQKGSYSIIPSMGGKASLLLRNTPKDEQEAIKAINILKILLEHFEQRLIYFEGQLTIHQKNESLEKKNSQIKSVIKSCCNALNKISEEYQTFKVRQIDLLEGISAGVDAAGLELSESQLVTVEKYINTSVMRYLESASGENIIDHKFLKTIQKLDCIFNESDSQETNTLKVSHISCDSQRKVNDLLESLGM